MPSTNLKKEATDPSKSIKLNMNVQFDDKKMSLMFTNTAIADVTEKLELVGTRLLDLWKLRRKLRVL
ncbi:hypothetical protein L5515_013240 [Caenorhabditis briggsae]|uniref:Uncharacterized protein n=1 Tax=Caenorhabditis briggsae TaxID=6238 RepID=A0AAE9E7M5_CAEBR|nr:hypothetical protein L5515_013240 [Caenorhabditis briggsae]